MTPPIRVVLVDDHTLFRKGLAELLERDGIIKVVGITGNTDEARRLLKEQKPDVAIMDLHMPSGDGVSLLKQMRQDGIDIPTLLLTVSDAEEDLANALRAGARGYLLKDMEPDEVVDAVQRAARGETVVAPAMTAKLVNLLDSKARQRRLVAGSAHAARTRNPVASRAGPEQQDDRARAQHQPRHGQNARQAHPHQTQPVLARASRGIRRRA